MKLRYKITGLILSIAMLLSIFTPLTVSAEEVKEKLVKEEAPRELTLEDILAGAATVEEVYGELERASVPEIVGYEAAKEAMHVRRLYADEGDNLNKVVFLNADLTKTVYLFDHPVKFVGEKGKIQDITLEIEEDLNSDTFRSANASAVTSFSKNPFDGIGLRDEGVSISLVPILPEKSASTLKNGNSARLENRKKVVYSYDTKTELEYTLTYTGFKEEIVVKEYTGQTRYDFTLYTNGLRVVEKNGSFSLADSLGKIRALLGDIIIFTADEKNNTMGKMKATPVVENQEYLISVFVDADFLSDPKTTYPIRIDPGVEICYDNNGSGAIEDVTINSLQGSDGFSGSLFVGKRDTYGVSRVLMKFPGLDFDSMGEGVAITAAVVRLRDLLPDDNEYGIYCHVFTGNVWSESTANWSNVLPNYYNPQEITWRLVSRYIGERQSIQYTFGFDITPVVAGWKAGTYVQNKGILFKAADSLESGSALMNKTFGSYNRSSYKPTLTVTYSENVHTTSEGVYYLNNAYSGKYLCYSSSQGLGVQSGLIANLGDTIRWQLIAAEGANNYALASNVDPTKYLAIKDDGSLEVVTHTSGTLPARCIWFRGVTGSGGYLRSTYNSRFLISNGNALSTAATQGTSGTDAFRQSSWRIASTSYYGNTSAYNGRELQSGFSITCGKVDVGDNVILPLEEVTPDALWTTEHDFTYASLSGNIIMSGANVIANSEGIASVTATHKVTGLTTTFSITVLPGTFDVYISAAPSDWLEEEEVKSTTGHAWITIVSHSAYSCVMGHNIIPSQGFMTVGKFGLGLSGSGSSGSGDSFTGIWYNRELLSRRDGAFEDMSSLKTTASKTAINQISTLILSTYNEYDLGDDNCVHFAVNAWNLCVAEGEEFDFEEWKPNSLKGDIEERTGCLTGDVVAVPSTFVYGYYNGTAYVSYTVS